MSFIISNKSTQKQRAILAELEYLGQGKYAADQLTVEEAAKIIDELFVDKKYTTGQIREIAADYYDLPIVDIFNNKGLDVDDPFSNLQRRTNA